VLVSSHVLEDIARTCDAVVLLRDGEVVRAGMLRDLQGTSAGAFRVRVSGDQEAFLAALAARRLAVERTDDQLVVQAADDAALDAIRDAAAEAGVGLRALVPAVATIEDVLVGAIEGGA
jgi:ABC-2 type transport system ATP-binding protein